MFVSTLEVRKNHLLLVNVWQRLIAKHGADAVPELLFVGKMGWMIQELKTRLQETNYLNGKVVHFDSLLDADLSEAYRRCLFTIYPSFCEGWGLPISESLGHGKFCIASNRASMPEVGGDLCDYFDPSNEDDAFRTIEHAVLDSSYIAARNEQVVRSYVPGSWDGFIETLMTELARLPGAAGRPA
jgi:glycosyltransferase involved in cell wall biosynthesis